MPETNAHDRDLAGVLQMGNERFDLRSTQQTTNHERIECPDRLLTIASQYTPNPSNFRSSTRKLKTHQWVGSPGPFEMNTPSKWCATS